MNPKQNNKPKPSSPTGRSASRGAAIRAQRRSMEDAQRVANQYSAASPVNDNKLRRANVIDDSPRLRIIGLGGMDGAGSKNTMLLEYKNQKFLIYLKIRSAYLNPLV